MQRSASSARVAEEMHFSEMDQLLPTYDPSSDVAKKEASRMRSAEGAVHLIPFVLILCALILWFFSTSEARM